MLKYIKECGAGPFSISTSFKDDENEFKKFVGRNEQINIILNDVENVRDTGHSRAIRLQGEGGVGKSALFNFIWRGLKNRLGTPRMQEILQNHHVEVGFVTCTDEILNFIGFWKLLCETLEIDNQNFFELLLYRILVRLWNIYNQHESNFNEKKKEMENILFGNPPNFLNLNSMNFENLRLHFQRPQPPLSKPEGREKLKIFLTEAAWDMNKYPTNIVIPGKSSRKVKFDARTSLKYLSWLVGLIPDENNAFTQNWKELMNPDHHSQYLKTDGDVFKFFAWAKETFEWAEGKPLIFLIAIDEVLKPITRLNDLNAWKQLGTIFITMRDHLKYVLWVLIDTEEEWAQFDLALQAKSDLRSQIGGFINNKIVLDQLSIEEMVQVLNKRMRLFWEGINLPILLKRPIAPFTDEVFEYIIKYYNRKLRNCIKASDWLWSVLKNQDWIKKLIDYYQAMYYIRYREKDISSEGTFSINSLYPFEQKYLFTKFWAKNRFSTEGERSEYIEIALKKAFDIIKQDQDSIFGEIRQNRQLQQTRRPDVLVSFFANEGSLKTLNVEYQVKIYLEVEMLNKTIPLDHLKSSIELLENHNTDAFHLISTIPISENIRSKLEAFKTRIINVQPINNLQLTALICFQEFTNIFRRNLTIIEAKNLLETILNKPWKVYLEDLKLVSPWAEFEGRQDDLEKITELEGNSENMGTISTQTNLTNSISSENNQSVQEGLKLPDEVIHEDIINFSISLPQHVEEIQKVVPEMEKCENAFIYALKYAYNNKRVKNSITLSTLKKNLPSEISSSDLKVIFKIPSSRFHQIPADKPQTFLITADGRSFIKKYKLI